MTELNPNSSQAKMSRRILTAIRKDPTNFDMSTWYNGTPGVQFVLRPSEKPACGTVMCLAGWSAHFDGWSLDTSGGAVKLGSTQRSISSAGREGLHLPLGEDDLFYTSDDVAVACLMRMASGEEYTDDMLAEETLRSDNYQYDYDEDEMPPGADPTKIRARQLLGLDSPDTVMAE